MYNYYEAVKNDVIDYINNKIDFKDYNTIDDLRDYLYDELFCEDSVTGNGSGSYTFNRYQAGENLAGNFDLLGDALEEFGCDGSYIVKNGEEACDVTIRCYLLPQAIDKAMDEIEDDFNKAHENEQ